ncbi:MAG: desulfoferrodoxin [Spirochaetales bacterium]|nr:desulfoferrodoxin [Spirochaetales bacterium]
MKKVYKCDICGNLVELLVEGGGELVCCGQPMTLQVEKTADAATEKHVPVIEKTENGFMVTVGSTLHPMLEEHYIEYIELIADGISYKKFLKPGEKPEALFCISASRVSAREHCNVHGLWKGTL